MKQIVVSRPGKPASRSGRPSDRGAGRDAAFDLWLNRGLHQLFDGVAKEPIPPELLRLIESHRLTDHQGAKDQAPGAEPAALPGADTTDR